MHTEHSTTPRDISVSEFVKMRNEKLENMKANELMIGDIVKRCRTMTGTELISKERERQITEEGYNWLHDDAEDCHKLSDAAIVYACPAPLRYQFEHFWPWDKKFFKPDTTYTIDGRIRELTKAGALIAAEIDRLIRLKQAMEE